MSICSDDSAARNGPPVQRRRGTGSVMSALEAPTYPTRPSSKIVVEGFAERYRYHPQVRVGSA